MSTSLPTVTAPKGRLTEREVRTLGASANRLVNLRDLQATQVGSGSLSVTTKTGTVSLTLRREDIETVLSLLVERESLLLLQFDVELDAPAI